jgi:hypothetical protein
MVSQGDHRIRPHWSPHPDGRFLAARGSVAAQAIAGREGPNAMLASVDHRHPAGRAGASDGQRPLAVRGCDVGPTGHANHGRHPSGPTPGPLPRRRVITQAAIVLGVLGLVASLIVVVRAPTGTPPNSSATTLNPLLARALRDGAASGWTRMTVTSAIGTQSVSVSSALGLTTGERTITSGKNSVSLVVTGRAAYVRASGPAGLALLDLPSTDVTGPTDGWSSIPSDDAGFKLALADTTLAGALRSELSFVGPTRVGPKTVVLAHRVTPISGQIRIPGRRQTQFAVLDVTDAPRPLPLELNSSSPSFSETVIFGSWGVATSIEAPTPTTSSAKKNSDTGSAG